MWIALIVVIVLIMYVVFTYNSLVQKRNKVKNSWSQIDVQLKRRFDLIPNLLETVKGYAAHEKDTFEAVTNARTKYMSADNHQDAIDADTALTKGLGRLFAVAEAYPELRANANFIQLQEELKNTENKMQGNSIMMLLWITITQLK